MGIGKAVVSSLLIGAAVLAALFFGSALYGFLTESIPLQFIVWGGAYVLGLSYCIWRMTANYRDENAGLDFGKENGAFWVLVALCWTYALVFAGAAIYFWGNIPAVIIVLALCAFASHTARNSVWEKFVITIGKDKAASVKFLKTRLSLIAKDDPRFLYRLARKFMQHTRKEGNCVILPGLFAIGEEEDAQISTQNEPLDFVSQEMTPDKFKNDVTWNLLLGIDEDDPSASTKYGDFTAVKRQIVSVINSAITPWISTEDSKTPQDWWRLRQRKEEVRRIAIRALLKTFGPEFESDVALDAAIELAALGKVVKLPLLGRILKLITCDVRTDEAVEKKATAIGLEALEREAELADTETQAQKAQKILDRMSHMPSEDRKRFIEAFGLVSDIELIKEGHGYAVRGDPVLGVGAMLAGAISGRGSNQSFSRPQPDPVSQSPVLPPPRSSVGKRRGKRGR